MKNACRAEVFPARKELTHASPSFAYSLYFSVPAYGQDIPSDAAANPPGQVKYAPVRDLSQLPMDGGWTYGEVLDKAAAGDFRANMLAGEYWMGLYYLNRGDLPLACLEHMQHFSVMRPRHPAIRHPSS